jgi:hypothetical protein
MKVSKYVLVDEDIPIKSVKLLQLKLGYKTKKQLYIVCTSYKEGELFHIIKSNYIDHHYKNCYVVAIARTKEKAIDYVAQLIDELYNIKTKTYDMLMR